MIEIRNVSHEVASGVRPLDGIDLELTPGRSVAILGPNGSGKSTLLGLLSGLQRPTHGEILVDGVSAATDAGRASVRRSVGIVFQNPDDQIVSSVVESELAFGLENLGVPWEEMHERVSTALDQFSLSHYRRHDPHALSGGERQRLAIASVMILRPRYLLLDEPTSLLDPVSRSSLIALLNDVHNLGDTTTITVTQLPDEARCADRVLVLSAGRVVLDGPPEEILSRPSVLRTFGLAAPLCARVAARCGVAEPVPLDPEGLAALVRPAVPGHEPPSARSSGQSILRAESLAYTYNRGLSTESRALAGVDLTVSEGHIVAVVGKGGSGKSTFVLHTNGLHAVQSGSLEVCGAALHDPETNTDDLRRNVGLVFQFPESQLFAETVSADVAFGPRNLSLDDLPGRVARALTTVGLDSDRFGDRNPTTLSGGEKRRVALAGVLAMTPRLLVLDEPFAGLDPAGADELDTLLRALRDRGITILLVTHDMDRAARISDRVVGFSSGRVAFDNPPAVAFSDSSGLGDIGLAQPEAARVAADLRRAGIGLPEDIVNEDQLAACLTVASS